MVKKDEKEGENDTRGERKDKRKNTGTIKSD